MASVRCGVRTSTRSPEAAASRSATLVSAISRPRPMTTRWSAVSSSSLIRWLETSTARPSAASDRSRPADPDDALGVQAVDRLVEHQHRRVAEQRRGDAEPLPHAEREAAGPASRADGRRPDLVEHLVDPPGGEAVAVGQPQQVVAGSPAGVHGSGVEQRADLGQRVTQRRGTAGRRPARRRSSGASSPRISRMVVDLPAPLGPTNPVTSPGWTVNDRPSTATVPPYRLRSSAHLDAMAPWHGR